MQKPLVRLRSLGPSNLRTHPLDDVPSTKLVVTVRVVLTAVELAV